MTRRLCALASASIFGLIAAMPAAAQELPVGDTPPLATESAELSGDIVVTARRRAERLIDVPVAVTAYSGEALAATGAIDITEISDTTPNVTLEASRGTNNTLTAFIRGVGQQDPVAGFEAGVGIYLDDVYLNRPQAAVLDIYDVERIEVLRGPQGTLYGRNTIGGAVKYVTRRLPQELEVRARATYGSYDQADAVVSLSAPLGDLVRVGGAVARLSRGGFGETVRTLPDGRTVTEDNYNKDIWAGRATLEIGGYDAPVLIRISGDYTKDESNPRGGHRLIRGLQSGAPVLDNVFDSRTGLNFPKQDVEAYGLAMNVTADLGSGFTLRSISSWREDTSFAPIDFDALASIDVDVPAIYTNDQISQEFQLLYESDRLNGLLGFYYLEANASNEFDVLVYTTVANFVSATLGDVRTKTWSVFGDFTFDITDQLALSLGGRFTNDQRRSTILRQRQFFPSEVFDQGVDPILFSLDSNFQGQAEFEKFTPRASLSFKPNDDLLLYASWSQGFKGGGFDPRGLTTAARDFNDDGVVDYDDFYEFLSFDPETVDSYEVGVKGSVFDRRLTFALTGFYADYKDVQVPGSAGFDSDGDGTFDTFIGITTNAGAAEFKGVELETNAILAEGFAGDGSRVSFAGTLGYIDGKYTEFVDATNVDRADVKRIQNTPEWTLSGTLGAAIPLGGGLLTPSTTVSYRSKTFQFETPSPFLDQDGYALWDASLVWTAPDDRFSLGVHAKNITDKEYLIAGYQFISAQPDGTPILAGGNVVPTLGREGVVTGYYGNPRQIFVTGTVKF